jgi:hypothetical protein
VFSKQTTLFKKKKFCANPWYFCIKLSIFFPPVFRAFVLVLYTDFPTTLFLFCLFSVTY